MQKALVTGGAGFIGSHLVDALVAKGIEVTVLDDLSTGKKENLATVIDRITFTQGCVSDDALVAEAAKDADTIFHLAAIASVAKSVEDPVMTYKINTGGTLSALEAARKHNVSRVVYASSSGCRANTLVAARKTAPANRILRNHPPLANPLRRMSERRQTTSLVSLPSGDGTLKTSSIEK